ncbi:MAG: single-stranded DNA-binding protein [Deltaproteobacteria bacterium]|jgi:single-strand DNA-binding protein|nr:single-stranded DNA-binding protein [Deltaproteobacteria bacterium]
MIGVNKVILLGRLGRAPEIKYTPTGKTMVTFSLGTSEKWGDEERTEWHKIIMFDRVAEVANQYLRKGDNVYLEGKIQYRSWEDKAGIKRYSTDIICNVMKMLYDKKETHKPETVLPPEAPPVAYELNPQPIEEVADPALYASHEEATISQLQAELPSEPQKPEDDEEPLPSDDDMPF